jgi:hypothetical protein
MMAMLREPDMAPPGGDAIAPAPTRYDLTLCTICRTHPRLASLSRCATCIQKAADADRQARANAEAKVKASRQANGPAATKRCGVCKVEKPLDEFRPHHRAKDGKRKSCRDCVRAGRALCKPMRPEQAAVQKLAASKPARRAKNNQAVAAWASRNPLAARARQMLMRAKRRGAIAPPETCQVADCNSALLIAHHPDYAQPLMVLFTCRRHHRLLHNGVALRLKAGVPARLKRIPKPETAVAA